MPVGSASSQVVRSRRNIQPDESARVSVRSAGGENVFIVANCTAGAAPESAAARAYTGIARVLAAENLAIGQERVFASVDAQPPCA